MCSFAIALRLSDFASGARRFEIYRSFQHYPGQIPDLAVEIIGRMINGDWLSSYRDFSGVENTLNRIDVRIQARMGNRIKLVDPCRS